MAAVELSQLKDRIAKSSSLDFKTARRFLQLARENSLRESELVVQCGKRVLQSVSSLGDESNAACFIINCPWQHVAWTVYEQAFIAALDSGDSAFSDECLSKLAKQFPGSKRVDRLKGLRLEARGEYQKVEEIYNTILDADPTDQTLLKRKIALSKAQGQTEKTVKLLMEYLNIFMADTEAWLELADIYIGLQLYEKATFCYEELLMALPQNYHLYVRYADLLYSIGGLDNLEMARKYYSFALELSTENNIKALYGLALVTNLLASTSKAKDASLNAKLNTLAVEQAQATYERSKVSKHQLEMVAASLQSLKV